MSVAGIQTLGAELTLDVAREADALGYDSVWVAEANAAEAMSLLGAISQVAPQLGLGTGVLALQLRTPPLHAMAAATLQQLAGDRDVYLGIGISSPAVAGQWHGAGYTDRPIAQVREFVTLLRECLSGETVTFEGDFYTVKRFRLGVRLGDREAEDRRRRAERADAAARAASIADGVLLNYLPASLVPWCVERVREGGDARRLRVRALRRDRPRPLRRPRAQGPPQLRGRRRVREPVRSAAASPTTSRQFRERWAAPRPRRRARRDRRRVGRRDPDHGRRRARARRRCEALRASRRRRPIVFALPWGEDRRATVSETLQALA